MITIGLIFWWPVFSDEPESVPTLGRIAYVFAAFVLSAFLGLALTFAPPLYGYYESLPERLWGISAAKDQNLGGILMTTEQALILFAAVVWLLCVCSARRTRRRHGSRRSSAPRDCSREALRRCRGERGVEGRALARGAHRRSQLGIFLERASRSWS